MFLANTLLARIIPVCLFAFFTLVLFYVAAGELLTIENAGFIAVFKTAGAVFEGGLLIIMGAGLLWAMLGALRPNCLFFARQECKIVRHAVFFPLLLSANAFFMLDLIAEKTFMAGAVCALSLLITLGYWVNIRAPLQKQNALTNIKVLGKG